MVEEDTGVGQNKSKSEGMPNWEHLSKAQTEDSLGSIASRDSAGSWVLLIAERGSRTW
jgi:hypothetical protein